MSSESGCVNVLSFVAWQCYPPSGPQATYGPHMTYGQINCVDC